MNLLADRNANNKRKYQSDLVVTITSSSKCETLVDFDFYEWSKSIKRIKQPINRGTHNFYYFIPEEFVEATCSRFSKSERLSAIDNLVPQLDCESYTQHLHGILYLEELYFQREFLKHNRDDAYFRVVKSYYGVHYEDVMNLRPAIQIGINQSIFVFRMCFLFFFIQIY